MAVLDTTGLWSEGDDWRVINAMNLPFSQYVLGCVAGCMNDLENMSTGAVQEVLDLLTDYGQADQAEIEFNLADTEGKILVKADVLEWEVTKNGTTGPKLEKQRIDWKLRNIFSFCSCLGGALGGGTGGTCLIRS